MNQMVPVMDSFGNQFYTNRIKSFEKIKVTANHKKY